MLLSVRLKYTLGQYLNPCGSTLVNPGDFIVADLMGVVVIPLNKAEEVVELAIEQGEREIATREWVQQGKTIEDLLAKFGRI